MNYNPRIPIAVFLGPTLESVKASEILTANYFPPVRMGDIYRLLGSGVHTIALIDGIFHGQAAVWQREILEALDNNIEVIGASSMGALRAAELYPFGMVGCGTIFEWYRDGIIDGDDEVALNHGDESNGFRLFSEPLVNIRYNLMQAVEQKHISQEQFEVLIEDMKKTYYGDRSYKALFKSLRIKKWPQKDKNRLIQHIKEKSVDLKKRDAIYALKHCETNISSLNVNITPSLSSTRKNVNKCATPHPSFHPLSVFKRGFLQSEKYLVSAEELLTKTPNYLDLKKSLQPVATKKFFLCLWAQSKQIKCPSHYLDNHRKKWEGEHIKSDFSRWMRSNGLTEREFDEELEKRALLSWIVEQTPDHFGLEFQPYAQFLEALLSLSTSLMALPQDQGKTDSGRRAELLREASETCLLASWAEENGIEAPTQATELFIKEWEENHQIEDRTKWLEKANLDEETYISVLADRFLYRWIIEKGCHYFGFDSWALDIAVIKELQMTGQIANLIEQIESPKL